MRLQGEVKFLRREVKETLPKVQSAIVEGCSDGGSTRGGWPLVGLDGCKCGLNRRVAVILDREACCLNKVVIDSRLLKDSRLYVTAKVVLTSPPSLLICSARDLRCNSVRAISATR